MSEFADVYPLAIPPLCLQVELLVIIVGKVLVPEVEDYVAEVRLVLMVQLYVL